MSATPLNRAASERRRSGQEFASTSRVEERVRQAAIMVCEALEPRWMMSIAPGVSGVAEIDEDLGYSLKLSSTGDAPASWTINWGDGTPVQAIPGTATSARHVYASAGMYSIQAAAKDINNVSYPATFGLDSSFGGDGLVTTSFGAFAIVNALVVQADGKIVAAGSTDTAAALEDFAVARFNQDGSLDTSFGNDGILTTELSAYSDFGYGVALQSDGKIIVAGQTNAGAGSLNFGLARYDSDGNLDASFGDQGTVSTDFGGGDVANAVSMQSDGKIVVAGFANSNDFAVARYNEDGSLDGTFDGDGKITTDFGGNDRAKGLLIQSDNNILVVGSRDGLDFAMARYDSSGALDASFSGDGKQTTDLGGNDVAESVALLSDGRIIVSGTTGGDAAFALYSNGGTLDNGFDSDGKLTSNFGGTDIARGLLVDSDDRFSVAISSGFVARFNENGTFDGSFGDSGKIATVMTPGALVSPDGQRVVAGGVLNGDFAVAQFNPTNQVVVKEVDDDLTAPQGLVATVQSTSQVRLHWRDRSNDEAGFSVYRSTDGLNFVEISTTGANATTKLVSGLTADTTYYFYLAADGAGGGESDRSNVVVARTSVPNVPSNIAASATSLRSAVVTWTNNSSFTTSYRIQRSANGTSGWTSVGEAGPGATRFTDKTVVEGTTNYYRVAARNGDLLSSYSSNSNFIVLPVAAPSDVWVESIDHDTVRLHWTNNSAAVDTFEIEYWTEGQIYTTTSTGTSTFKDISSSTNIKPERTYQFRIRAKDTTPNPDVVSDWANTVSLTTPPRAPAKMDVQTDIIGDNNTIFWYDHSQAEDGYIIERSTDYVHYTRIATVGANVTAYLDEDVPYISPGGPPFIAPPYNYRVFAFNEHGTSDALVYPFGAFAPLDSTPTLTAPADYSATLQTGVNRDKVFFAWTNPPSQGGFGTTHQISEDGIHWKSRGGSTTASPELSAGINYQFRAYYAQNGNYSDYWNVPDVTTSALEAPTNLQTQVLSGTQIKLTWSHSGTYVHGYVIERENEAGQFVYYGQVSAPATKEFTAGLSASYPTGFNVVSLHPGQSYKFRVRAYRTASHGFRDIVTANHNSNGFQIGVGYSAYSSSVQATTTGNTVSVTATDASASESGGTGQFRVARTGSTAAALDVSLSFTGLATDGVDYQHTSHIVSFAIGESEKFITVTPLEDDQGELDETVIATVNPSNLYGVSGSPATVTITNNDPKRDNADLSITDIPEEDEETIGGFVNFNDDFHEGNTGQNGGARADYEPNAAAGHRINVSDPDLRDASVLLDGQSGNWSLQYPENLLIWREVSPGQYVMVKSGELVPTSQPEEIRLKIEGISPSAAAEDTRVRLRFYPSAGGDPSVDTVRLTVAGVALNVDGNNNDGYNLPEQNRAEERVEEETASTNTNAGKVVYENDDDADGDGVLDYGDGFNRDGINGNADDTSAGDKFVPMVVSALPGVDLEVAQFRIAYSNPSDPAAMSGTTPPSSTYLRVWNTDGGQTRNKASVASGGNYVGPGEYSSAQLGLTTSDPEGVLWLECVRITTSDLYRHVTVEVDPDGQGPAGFQMSDSVFLKYEDPAFIPATISGYKWNDLNGNGIREGSTIAGTPPDVVFVLDVSSSTWAGFLGSPIGDINDDGRTNTILDAELQGFLDLNQGLIDLGFGGDARVSLVVFGTNAGYLDLDPSTPGKQLHTSPDADRNGDGVRDIEAVLSNVEVAQGGVGTGTYYGRGLTEAVRALEQMGTADDDANVIFLSDGYPDDARKDYQQPIDQLRAMNAKLHAFGAGLGASPDDLRNIDGVGAIYTTTDTLLTAFDHLTTGGTQFDEPPLAGVTVYADADNDGIKDSAEKSAVTDANGNYTLIGLAAGTYVVREIVPTGWSQTFPAGGAGASMVVTAGQVVNNVNFGNRFTPAIDVDVDSDNTNSLSAPDRNTTEENLESNVGEKGKIIYVNDGDADDDSVADNVDLDLSSASQQFTPLVVDLSTFSSFTNTTLRFTYSGADPALIGDGVTPNSPNHLRIWKKNSTVARVAADYVPSDTDITASSLGFTTGNKIVTFWVEGVALTETDAQRLITVEVDTDGAGPLVSQMRDSVYVRTRSRPPTHGAVRGHVFHDRDRDGVRDGTLLVGSKPDVVFVVDRSGSTSETFKGTPVGDVNDDGLANTILDAELAGFLVLNQQLIDLGYASTARVSIVAFDDGVETIDLGKVSGSLGVTFLRPDEDRNDNGVPDIGESLARIWIGGGTLYAPALNKAKSILTNIDSPFGSANVFFISDGAPGDVDADITTAANNLRTQFGANVRAFGAGQNVPGTKLALIDSRYTIFSTTDQLLGAFAGLAGADEPEEGLAGWQVYLDADNDSTLDAGELNDTTDASGQFEIGTVPSGSQTLRVIRPSGWIQTAPTSGVPPVAGPFTFTLAGGQSIDGRDFGVVENEPQPSATIDAPATVDERSPANIFVNNPQGIGPFRYSFDFDDDLIFDEPGDIWRSRVNVGSFTPDDGHGLATRLVNVRIHDSVGQFTTYENIEIDVNNVAPIATIGGGIPTDINLTTVPSGDLQLDLKGLVIERSEADQTAGIDYDWTVTRNGTVIQTGTAQNIAITIDPQSVSALGTYVVEFTATDKDGGVGDDEIQFVVRNSGPRILSHPTAVGGSTVSGTFVDLAASATDDEGPQNLAYTWSTVSGPAAVTFDPNSTTAAGNTRATFTEAGNYSLRVTVQDAAGNSIQSNTLAITVNHTATRMTLSPSAATVAASGTVPLTATVYNQFDDVYTPGTAVSWTITNSPDSGSVASNTNTTATYTADASPPSGATDQVKASLGAAEAYTQIAVAGGATADRVVGSAAQNARAVEDADTGFVALGRFIDLDQAAASGNIGQYTATITWGDGVTENSDSHPSVFAIQLFTQGSVTGYEVLAKHTYTSPGTKNYTITFAHDSSGRSSPAIPGTFVVAPAPVTLTLNRIAPLINVAYTAPIASFTSSGTDIAADFTADITWGDATSNQNVAVTLNQTTGKYEIAQSHTYATTGSKNVSVTLKKNGVALGTASGSITVSSQAVPVPGAADPVDGFRAVTLSASQIYLDWLKDPQADGYIIWVQEEGKPARRIPSNENQIISPTQAPGANDHDRYYRVDQGLLADTTYTYTIQAVYPDGSISPLSPERSATTQAVARVPAPAGLRGVHLKTPNSLNPDTPVEGVLLTWDPGDVDGYKVEREMRTRASASDPWGNWELDLRTTNDRFVIPYPLNEDGKVTYFDAIDLTPGLTGETEVNYLVTAVYDAPRVESPTIETGVIQRDTTPPGTPTNVRAAGYPQAIQLGWDDRLPEDDHDFSGWLVERSLDDGTTWTQLNVSPVLKDLGYDDTTAPVGEVSWYRVRAADLLGNLSSYSEVVKHRRPTGTEPASPTGLRGEAGAGSDVQLNWDSVANATSYKVYRKLVSDPTWSDTPIATRTVTHYLDDTTTQSFEYQYRVTALNGQDESGPSSVIQILVGDGAAPTAPAAPTLTALSTTSIKVEWGYGSTTGIARFEVYRSRQSGAGFELMQKITSPATSNTWTDNNLAANTAYHYRIVAVQTDGDFSVPGTAASTSTLNPPEARPVVSITNFGDGSIAKLEADAVVRGVVDDPNNNLTGWELYLQPRAGNGSNIDSSEKIVLGSGSGSSAERGQAPNAGVALATIKATLLPNGLYELVLRGTDAGGEAFARNRLVEIDTDVKLGNFTLPVTDMEIDVPGSDPIFVRRVYDSARTNDGDFGPGWHLQLSETHLRTTARKGQRGSDALPALRFGDLVYVDIPGRGQQAFQFLPKPDNYDPVNPGQGLVMNLVSYKIQFVAIDGSNTQLIVEGDIHEADSEDRITLKRDGDEFFLDDVGSQTVQPGYNPARAEFGDYFRVVTEDGMEYEINATTGTLKTSKTPNSVVTTYTDGLVSAGNNKLHIERDGDGRILWIAQVLSDGSFGPKVTYEYAPGAGADLLSVTDQTGKITKYAYHATLPHYLTKVTDGRNVESVEVEYDQASGEVTKITDADGAEAPLTHGAFDGHEGVSTVEDLEGNLTERVYNHRGDVVREIRHITNGAGQATGYEITVRTYQYNAGHLLDPLDEDFNGESGVNKLFAFTEYQPFVIEHDVDDLDARYKAGVPTGTPIARKSEFHGESAPVSDRWRLKSESVAAADGVTLRTTQFSDYVMGKPQKIVDPNGGITWMIYDAVTGNLKHTINALGEGTAYTYTVDGQVRLAERVKDNDGNATTKPLAPIKLGGPALTRNTYVNGRLSQSTDAANLTTRYAYWPDGRVQSVRTSSDAGAPDSYTEYDSAGRVKQTSDTDGPVSQNIHDKAGNLLATVDRFGGETIYSYDARGNLVRTLHPDGTETRSVYDSMGRVTWSTDRFQGDSACTLNAFTGALVWTNQDDSATTVLTHTMYDSLGRVTGTQRYAGRKIAISNPDGNGVFTMTEPNPSGWTAISSTSTVYDDRGRVVETTDGSGLRTGNVYYPNGQLHRTGPLEDAAPVGGPYNLSNDFVHYTTYAYDLTDNLPAGAVSYNSVADANGNTTRTYVDVLGRTIRTTFDDGTFTQTLYGVADQPVTGHTVAGQTIQGQQVTRIDPQGIATDSFYDVAGRLTDVYQPAVLDRDPSSATFNTSVRPHWNYQYDARGNLTKQTDAKGRATSFAYDERGRRTSRTLPGDAASPAVSESWTYDGKGRVRTHTSFAGKTTLYAYDPDPRFGGRLKEEWRYDRAVTILGQDGVLVPPPPPLIGLPGLPPPGRPDDSTPDEKTVYTYDELGRAETVTEYKLVDADAKTFEVSRATTTYEYDAITGGITLVDSPEGKLRHEYDPATGRLIRTYTGNADPTRTSTDGDGKAVTDTRYEYNDLGQLWKTTVNELRDDTLTTPKTTAYTYDAAGNLDTVSLPNGQVSDYDYDDLNRLDTLTVRDAQSDKLFEQDYTLASDGQRESVLEKRYDGSSPAPFSTTFIDWSYDALNRLTGETRDEGNNGQSTANDYVDSYDFDLVGNRVKKTHNPGNTATDHVTTNEYNIKDQLTKENHNTDADADIDQVIEFTYDKNGSTISKKENGVVTEQYQHDLSNRLIGIDNDADGDIASNGDHRYGYDHNGNRTSKETVGGSKVLHHNDNNNPTGYGQVLEEKATATSLPTKTFIIGNDVIGQVDAASSIQYLLYDGHGSVRGVADAAGIMVENYDYDGFGNPIAFVPADADSVLLHGGERHDAENDTYHLRARNYRPSTGRFDRGDPIGGQFAPGELGDANLYVYVGGNPVNGADPSGMFGVSLTGTLGTIGGGMALQSMLLPRAALGWHAGKSLAALLFLNGTPTGSPLTATQWQDPMSEGLIDALVAIDEFMNPPGGPGFWEGIIPVWGAGKTAGAHLANGNYMAAAVFAGIGALDVLSLGAIGTALRGAGRAGAAAAASATVKTAAMALGDVGEQQAVEMLIRSGFTDILPIKNASGNGLDIVARAADGHFLVMEVKTASDVSLFRSLPRNQANMDSVLARILDDAAGAQGRYQSIDASQRAQARLLRDAYRANPGNVSGVVAGFDASSGTMRVQRWARNGG